MTWSRASRRYLKSMPYLREYLSSRLEMISEVYWGQGWWVGLFPLSGGIFATTLDLILGRRIINFQMMFEIIYSKCIDFQILWNPQLNIKWRRWNKMFNFKLRICWVSSVYLSTHYKKEVEVTKKESKDDFEVRRAHIKQKQDQLKIYFLALKKFS